MEKQIEIFTTTLFDKEYTMLSVKTKYGYSLGVAPESLDEVIDNCIETDRYVGEVVRVDNQYGYVLTDWEIEKYLETGNVDDVYFTLAEIDEEMFKF